jgi:hypothetical protein
MALLITELTERPALVMIEPPTVLLGVLRVLQAELPEVDPTTLLLPSELIERGLHLAAVDEAAVRSVMRKVGVDQAMILRLRNAAESKSAGTCLVRSADEDLETDSDEDKAADRNSGAPWSPSGSMCQAAL